MEILWIEWATLSSSSIDCGLGLFSLFCSQVSKSQASHILLTRRNPVCETFAIAEGIQLGSKVGRVADSAAMPYNNELNHNESTKYTICYRLRLSKKEDLKKETHRRPFPLAVQYCYNNSLYRPACRNLLHYDILFKKNKNKNKSSGAGTIVFRLLNKHNYPTAMMQLFI